MDDFGRRHRKSQKRIGNVRGDLADLQRKAPLRLARIREEHFHRGGDTFTRAGRPTDRERTIEATGQIVFISPEIDPLNSQVRFWAEIENAELKLRPGMTATLTIEPKGAR